jgi:plastocyanin
MRTLGLLVATLMVLTALPASSSTPTPPGSRAQTINDGEILLPTRFPLGDAERDGYPGLSRRLWLCSAETNRTTAFIFDVNPATWGGAFLVDDVTDQTGAADVDVYFYSEFGDCGGTHAPVTSAELANDGPIEAGTVPTGAIKAVVFSHNGVDTKFRYAGYRPPELDLAGPSLDLAVFAGNTVTWTNDTQDYGFVRHTPATGSAAFDSSPADNTGIPVGGTFSHTFRATGEYPYETSTGSGVITVIDPLG